MCTNGCTCWWFGIDVWVFSQSFFSSSSSLLPSPSLFWRWFLTRSGPYQWVPGIPLLLTHTQGPVLELQTLTATQLFMGVLEIWTQVLLMHDRHFTELPPVVCPVSPQHLSFETGSPYKNQDGLEFAIWAGEHQTCSPQSLHTMCWNYRHGLLPDSWQCSSYLQTL